MSKVQASAGGWRRVTQHVAVKALGKSVLINMLAPSLLYRLVAPHFDAHSLVPLAVSGLPPIAWLAYTVIKLHALDFLGLFAAENVIVSMAALILSHSEKQALVGRSLQNVVLAAIFLGSLAIGKPLVLYMARQLATGNDPSQRGGFDAAAMQPRTIKAYRVLTWGWTLGLLIKAAGSFYLASYATTSDYLVCSPLWDLVSDTLLVSWTMFYGRAKLSAFGVVDAPRAAALVPVGSEP
jgi:hypothetical protein